MSSDEVCHLIPLFLSFLFFASIPGFRLVTYFISYRKKREAGRVSFDGLSLFCLRIIIIIEISVDFTLNFVINQASCSSTSLSWDLSYFFRNQRETDKSHLGQFVNDISFCGYKMTGPAIQTISLWQEKDQEVRLHVVCIESKKRVKGAWRHSSQESN